MDRNAYLNPAFMPKWNPVNAPEQAALVNANPMGDTRVDPFQGTDWGRYLDLLGGKVSGLGALPNSPQAPSITPDERMVGGPYGTFGTGTGGMQPDGTGPGGNVPTGAGRLKAAVKGLQ